MDHYVVVLVTFFLILVLTQMFLMSFRLLQVLRSIVMSVALGAFANGAGIFTSTSWGWPEFFTGVWFAMALLSIVYAAVVTWGERKKEIESTRQKTFFQEFRGTYQEQGEFFMLLEHPRKFFYVPSDVHGDEGFTVDGHSVVLIVDTDPQKEYSYLMSQEKFSDGSRPLPVISCRNLTVFPE